MKLGICKNSDKASLVANAGFNYIETALTTVVFADDETFEQMCEDLKNSNLNAESMNLFVPGSFILTGPNADLVPVKEYLKKCFIRASMMGTKIQVFGSGGARNVPEGWPIEKALDQLVEFLNMAANYASESGISIAIEPLCSQECNIINTVTEALSLAKKVNLPNVGVLADWYHMEKQNEGVEGIIAAGDMLLHTHIAKPKSRLYPLLNDGEDYSTFFNALHQIGYTGRVSIEGNGEDNEFESSFKRLKAYL